MTLLGKPWDWGYMINKKVQRQKTYDIFVSLIKFLKDVSSPRLLNAIHLTSAEYLKMRKFCTTKPYSQIVNANTILVICISIALS
jgi:hypothetical protein